jgi:hypothetical protein
MSHNSNWWTPNRALNVTSHTSTWDAAFADNSLPAEDGMQDAWQEDLTRIEGFLDGNVGTHSAPPAQSEDADGFGPLGAKLRGYNFRDRAFTDVFTLKTYDALSVMTEPNMDAGSGVDPSPLPGGTIRFPVGRGGEGGLTPGGGVTSFTSPPVAMWVYYTANIVSAAVDFGSTSTYWADWEVRAKLNGVTMDMAKPIFRLETAVPRARSQVCLSWAIPHVTLPSQVTPDDPNDLSKKGWNVITHEVSEVGRGLQLVTKGTQLIVVVAYR